MNRSTKSHPATILTLILLSGLFPFAGCSKELAPEPASDSSQSEFLGSVLGSTSANSPPALVSNGTEPPAGLVSVSYGGEAVTIWPYTGESFNGVPSDPINLIFVGQADPVQIRAALLALDGDRSAFGFPSVPPFNARWSDADGGVQTAYTDGAGWSGSVIQLGLGPYGPIRTHLRLFRTGIAFGDGGVWTLAGAHFEVLIPGTTEHQVLSWELAQQIVTVDLIRSGLLVASGPAQTGGINQAPSFREIPDFVYNQLPPELIALIQGPTQPVSAPVPLANDGQASILHIATAPTVAAGSATESFTIQFGQAIPKPLCSDGPFDWVFVTGPVDFQKTAVVDALGGYRYQSQVSGQLQVTPVDITTNPPTPVGEPFTAMVSEVQEGFISGSGEMVAARSRRIAPQRGGSELLISDLRVGSPGPEQHRVVTQCLQPAP